MKCFMLVTICLIVLTGARVAQTRVDNHHNVPTADLSISIAAVYNISTAGDVTISTSPFAPLPYPPASDSVWNTCKCRGENFWKAMHTSMEETGKLFVPPRESSESALTEIAELASWAWKGATVQASYFDFAKGWGVDHVLRAIGVSDKATENGGSIKVVKVTHGDGDADGGGYGRIPYDKQPPYTAEGKSYHVSGSEYTFGFDPSGILLALDRKSPQFAGGKRNPKVQGKELPRLHAFSDVAWLKWKEITGTTPTSMRYFASLAITNDATRGILNVILTKAKFGEIPAWPGYNVDANTEEGAALLGSPNALAFSYFLVQHKATLGDLEISKITIFKNALKFPDPCLLLHVGRAELET